MLKMKNKKGFTLIELLAVIVILAILALIAIPIVISIINDSRENSYKRSIENYGKSVENAIASYESKNDVSELPLTISSYDVKTSGARVVCDDNFQYSGQYVKLTNCRVVDKKGNQKSKNSYTYKNRQVYVGSSDGSFAQGDTIEVNGVEFLVLKDGDETDDYVIAIKSVPLTVGELNHYGKGIVNRYRGDKPFNGQQIFGDNSTFSKNGDVGVISFYSNSDCGYINKNNWNNSGCTNVYQKSDVKKVVDNWASGSFSDNTLKKVDGYKARLITYDELTNDLKYSEQNSVSEYMRANCAPQDKQWIYGTYLYWTMSPYYDYDDMVWFISYDHLVPAYTGLGGNLGAVRPVINVYKSEID